MSKARPSDTNDAVGRIAAANALGDRRLMARKFDAMAQDAASFLRATAPLFFERLRAVELPPSPLIFGCGDLHLENFGSYIGDNRLAYFDQNDFDETALMPAAAELVRFATSVVVTIRLHEPDDLDARRAAKSAVAAYADALADGKPGWVERALARGAIGEILAGLGRRTQKQLLDLFSRVGRRGRRKLLRDGRRTLSLPRDAAPLQAEIKALLAAIGKERGEPVFWKMRDVACRIAGKGSLGKPRFVALVKGGGDPDRNFLIDIKSAWPSAAVPYVEARQPDFASDAERVLWTQRLVQARPPAFLHAAALGGRSFVLRELQPIEDKLAIVTLMTRPKRLAASIDTLARIAAWGELRAAGRRGSADADALIAFGAETSWRRPLLDAAMHCAAEIERDYASFETAWRKRDPRLLALTDA